MNNAKSIPSNGRSVQSIFEEFALIKIPKIRSHKTEKTFMEYIKEDEELAAKEMIKYWG